MFPKYKRIENKKVMAEIRKSRICSVCGRDGSDVHHLISVGSGGPDVKENLINLCRVCHNKAHDGSILKSFLFNCISVRECATITDETIYKIMRNEK